MIQHETQSNVGTFKTTYFLPRLILWKNSTFIKTENCQLKYEHQERKTVYGAQFNFFAENFELNYALISFKLNKNQRKFFFKGEANDVLTPNLKKVVLIVYQVHFSMVLLPLFMEVFGSRQFTMRHKEEKKIFPQHQLNDIWSK